MGSPIILPLARGGPRWGSVNERDGVLDGRNESSFRAYGQHELDAFFAALAEIEGEVVHVHADELVRQVWVQVAREGRSVGLGEDVGAGTFWHSCTLKTEPR